MVWPAVIAGAAMLGSALLNSKSQSDTNDSNIDLWREQAAYNRPINQMARYQEAGLNPNLVYSQGNPGNMGSAPALQAPRLDIDPASALQLDATLDNMHEQNNNLKEQNSLISTQNSVAKEQRRKLKLENDFFKKHGQWPSKEGATFSLGRSLFNSAQPILGIVAELLGSGVGTLQAGSATLEVNMNAMGDKEERYRVLQALRDQGIDAVAVWR